MQLDLSESEIDTILQALQDAPMPFRVSNPLIMKVLAQGRAQQAQAVQVPLAPAEAPEEPIEPAPASEPLPGADEDANWYRQEMRARQADDAEVVAPPPVSFVSFVSAPPAAARVGVSDK